MCLLERAVCVLYECLNPIFLGGVLPSSISSGSVQHQLRFLHVATK